MKLTPIILSGGSGTRLLPLSTKETPKQFLPLVSDRTMIQETLLRLDGLETSAPIISCNESQRFLVAQQIGEVSSLKPIILLEPMAKNTAPAIAAACFAALQDDKNAIVVVLPSDHVIQNLESFRNAVEIAAKNAEKGFLVTFGIVPSFPATGYGYIKTSKSCEDGAYLLEKFVEKPCLEKAQEYLKSGEYLWNSGMFVFKASSFIEELSRFNPEMCKLVKDSFDKANRDEDFIRLAEEPFGKILGDSIDYAVMEKTSRGKVVKLDCGWNDVGSWNALWEIQEKDADGNVVKGSAIALDTTSSLIYSKNRRIAAIGLDNIVIVDSGNSVLVAAKGKVQDVKKIAEKIDKK